MLTLYEPTSLKIKHAGVAEGKQLDQSNQWALKRALPGSQDHQAAQNTHERTWNLAIATHVHCAFIKARKADSCGCAAAAQPKDAILELLDRQLRQRRAKPR